MIRLQWEPREKNFIVENLRFTESTSAVIPRRGCVGLEAAENRFYIFGGIYDSRLDYYTSGSPVSLAVIQSDSFSITVPPKKKERYVQKLNFLKPKMHYRIERTARTS